MERANWVGETLYYPEKGFSISTPTGNCRTTF
jgi:hypothetical protein